MVIPSSQETTYPSHLYRLLLLRRLRRPLPLTSRFCRCRRALNPFGDHRAACAQAGILRSRGGPLERAAARICREAGARVTTNARSIDLNIDHVDTQDDRRIEVIANGLPLWGGAQLAVDTTLVSPLTRAGHPRMRRGQYRGTALTQNSSGIGGAASLSSGLKLEDVGAKRPQLSSGSSPTPKPAKP